MRRPYFDSLTRRRRSGPAPEGASETAAGPEYHPVAVSAREGAAIVVANGPDLKREARATPTAAVAPERNWPSEGGAAGSPVTGYLTGGALRGPRPGTCAGCSAKSRRDVRHAVRRDRNQARRDSSLVRLMWRAR